MNFDEVIDSRGTHSSKWDGMEEFTGVSNKDGLAMWVAVTDFKTAPNVLADLQTKIDTGVFGYFGGKSDFLSATVWWLENRHEWQISEDWIVPVPGLGTALAMAIEVFTKPGDNVVIFSPVYNEFFSKIENAERRVTDCPMVLNDGYFSLDFEAYDAMMTGNEKLLLWCSPHNPGGRVWTQDEHRQMAAFAKRHDLIVVSDEVHQDFVYSGNTHVPTAVAAPDISDRLLTLVSASKTFNIAGLRTGMVVVENEVLRDRLKKRLLALYIQPNALGLEMTTSCYSPEGAKWLDAQIIYLEENRRIFSDGMRAIPGVHPMMIESSFLSWVDFTATGMEPDEIIRRIAEDARIGVGPGKLYGKDSERFIRFNIGMPRSRIIEAINRLQSAFADLQ